MEAVNTNFKGDGLTRLEIKPESTAPEADTLRIRQAGFSSWYSYKP